MISIHALLAESDAWLMSYRSAPLHFNPRSPCGERLPMGRQHQNFSTFQSTLSLRRATDWDHANKEVTYISIHALLAESDVFLLIFIHELIQISIHALLAESDRLTSSAIAPYRAFQSTLSLRRATQQFNEQDADYAKFQSTLSLRRATGFKEIAVTDYEFQSTLSLRRATPHLGQQNQVCPLFQSTLSLRRATLRWNVSAIEPGDFNPRSPCGERPIQVWAMVFTAHFNPRSPCGERPTFAFLTKFFVAISIHALLAESDMRSRSPLTR